MSEQRTIFFVAEAGLGGVLSVEQHEATITAKQARIDGGTRATDYRRTFPLDGLHFTAVEAVEAYLETARRNLERSRELVLLQEERSTRALLLLEDLKDAP